MTQDEKTSKSVKEFFQSDNLVSRDSHNSISKMAAILRNMASLDILHLIHISVTHESYHFCDGELDSVA